MDQGGRGKDEGGKMKNEGATLSGWHVFNYLGVVARGVDAETVPGGASGNSI
jgi:hypothetical protein